jgi:MFS family permease
MATFRSFNRAARLFLLATVIDGVIFSFWSLFFNFFILAKGFDKVFLGEVNSIPSIAGLLFAIPIGLLSDRMGRRKAMLAGLVLSCLGMGLQVLSSHPALLIGMAFIGGLGSNLFMLSQAPFMMKTSTPANRTLLFSLNFGLQALSGAVGNLFAGQLPAFFSQVLHVSPESATAYQAILLSSVVLGGLALIPIFMIHEPADLPAVVERPASRPLRQVLLQPLVIKLILPQLLIGLGASILIPYINIFLQERFNLSSQVIGTVFSLSAVLTGLGSVLGPRLARSLGSKVRTVVSTQLASLVFLLLAGFTPWAWLSSASLLARGTLMNMSAPLYTAFAMEQVEANQQGVVNSALNLFWQMGFAIGPFISGVVQEKYGFSPLFIATAVLYFCAASLTWIFFKGHEKASAPVVVVLAQSGE